MNRSSIHARRMKAIARLTMPPITLRLVIRTGRLDQNNWQNLELVGKRSNLFHPKMLIESSNVARSNLVHDSADKLVSIRAPRAGRNGNHIPRRRSGSAVSIRAPRAGRNRELLAALPEDERFNPRPACGAKRNTTAVPASLSSFNPRPACGAKLNGRRLMDTLPTVSIRAPRAGRNRGR